MRVFNTDDGKLVLQDLRQRCFSYLPSFNPNAHIMAFNEGMRAVVLNIESRLLPRELQTKKEE
jgi:hypothetical protein